MRVSPVSFGNIVIFAKPNESPSKTIADIKEEFSGNNPFSCLDYKGRRYFIHFDTKGLVELPEDIDSITDNDERIPENKIHSDLIGEGRYLFEEEKENPNEYMDQKLTDLSYLQYANAIQKSYITKGKAHIFSKIPQTSAGVITNFVYEGKFTFFDKEPTKQQAFMLSIDEHDLECDILKKLKKQGLSATFLPDQYESVPPDINSLW